MPRYRGPEPGTVRGNVFDHARLLSALTHNRWHLGRTAEALAISRITLWRLMRRHRVRRHAPSGLPLIISGTTRVVAVLGDPVAHSRSPAMHNAAFAALGLDWTYVALRVRPADLGRALAGVRALGLAGLNVTVPHKERIAPLLDRLTSRAKSIGAVNTVFWRKGALWGDNTDAGGFLRALADAEFRPRGRSALVLGAGGSARAVVNALAGAGIGSLTVLNRTVSRARALRRLVPGRTEFAAGGIEEASDPATVAAADLIVNCTSLGLDGRSLPPLDLRAVSPASLVYDLVYGPDTTPLVRAARRRGLRAEDGRRMLLHQAALAFRLWTGKAPPLAAMAAAVVPS
jgi:shikimate dehydrogenase